MIRASELKKIVKEKRRLDVSVSEAEIKNMIAQIDYHENQVINYSEFLAATIDMDRFITESRLKIVFNQFDTDQSGKITSKNIILAMQKFGKSIEQAVVQKIIAQHDKTGDGMLNYDEYKMIFQDSNKIDLNKMQIGDQNA